MFDKNSVFVKSFSSKNGDIKRTFSCNIFHQEHQRKTCNIFQILKAKRLKSFIERTCLWLRKLYLLIVLTHEVLWTLFLFLVFGRHSWGAIYCICNNSQKFLPNRTCGQYCWFSNIYYDLKWIHLNFRKSFSSIWSNLEIGQVSSGDFSQAVLLHPTSWVLSQESSHCF